MFTSPPKNSRNKLGKNSRLNVKVKNRKQPIVSNRIKLGAKKNTKENQNKIKTVPSSIKKPETKKYQSTNKQITDLTDKIKLLDAEMIKLKSDLTQKEQELKTAQSSSGTQTTLQADLDQAKKNLESKEKELLAQKEAFDKKELSEKTLQRELQTLDTLLKSSNVSQSLKEENEKLMKKNADLEGKIKEIDQLKTNIETLRKEKEKLKTAVSEKLKEAAEFAQKAVAEVTKKMEKAIAKKDKELKDAKEKLSVEHKKIYEEQYKKQILELEKTIESLTDQLSGKNNTAQNVFNESTQANEARINELSQKVQPLEKENKELKEKIIKNEESKKVSQETETALTKEKELLTSKIKELENQISTLKSNNGTTDEKISQLNKKLELKNQALEDTNKKLLGDIASKEKELGILKEKDRDSSLWTAEKINKLRVAIEQKDTNTTTFKEYKANQKLIENAIKQLAKQIYYFAE